MKNMDDIAKMCVEHENMRLQTHRYTSGRVRIRTSQRKQNRKKN